jgi:hypothetical protein
MSSFREAHSRGTLSVIVLVAILSVGAAGCGGSSKPRFDAATTLRCLNAKGHGVKAYPYTNKLKLLTGSGGGLRVVFPFGSEWIYMVFGKDPAEAKAIEKRAVAVAAQREFLSPSIVLAGVRVVGNVFYYADAGPVTTVEDSHIDVCLR